MKHVEQLLQSINAAEVTCVLDPLPEPQLAATDTEKEAYATDESENSRSDNKIFTSKP